MIIKVKTFVEEVIVELKKVSWTSRQDLINSTLIVMVSSICLGCFITVVDLIVSKGLNLIIK